MKLPGIALNRLRSFHYALCGMVTLIKEQPNARLHLLATLLVVATGLYCALPIIQWLILFLTIAGVWVAEALNTAIEYLADALHPETHPLIKKAKDVAAAGVLIMSLVAVVIACLVFGPYWLPWPILIPGQ